MDRGDLPLADPFAAAPAAQQFVNVPWLAQVAGYQTHRLLGPEGLILGHVLLVTLSCGLAMLAITQRNLPLVWAVVGSAAGYVIALPTVGTIRPQLFGIALFPLVLLALSRMSARKLPLVWLPIVFAVWANLHGSFAMGLFALAIAATGHTLDGWRKSGQLQLALRTGTAARVWLALLMCVLAACLNPMGPRLLMAVASFGQTSALADITEWRPLVLKSLGGILFFGSLLATMVLLRFSPRRFSAVELLLLLTFGGLSLLSMRMLAWWALVWPWVVTPHAMAAWTFSGSIPEDEAGEIASTNTMRTLYAMAAVLVTLLWAPPSHALISGKSRGIGALTSSDTPLYVTSQIELLGVEGRLFAPMDWADFLIWNNPGRIKPLVYTHVHVVDPQAWGDFLSLHRGSPEWLAISRHYELDYLVLSRARNDALRRSVQGSPEVELLYQDQQSLLYRLLPPDRDKSKEGEPS